MLASLTCCMVYSSLSCARAIGARAGNLEEARIMRKRRMSRGKSKRAFRNGARRQHWMNKLDHRLVRGGIRL